MSIKHNTTDVIGYGTHNLNYAWTTIALHRALRVHLQRFSSKDIYEGMPSYKIEAREREACSLPKLYQYYRNYFRRLGGCQLGCGIHATIDKVCEGVSKVTLLMTDDRGGKYVIKISKHCTTKTERDTKKYHSNIECQLWAELDAYTTIKGTPYEKFIALPIAEYRNSGYYIAERVEYTCSGSHAINHMSEAEKNDFMKTVKDLQLWDVMQNEGNCGYINGKFKIIDFAL